MDILIGVIVQWLKRACGAGGFDVFGGTVEAEEYFAKAGESEVNNVIKLPDKKFTPLRIKLTGLEIFCMLTSSPNDLLLKITFF